MTAAVVGLGSAVMVSVSGGTTGIADLISSTVSSMDVNGSSDSGSSSEPGGSSVGADGTWLDYLAANGDDSTAAAAAAEANAPDGYYFSGWIDGATGQPLYTANDQQSFSVGGNNYGFNQYWSSVASGSYPI